LALPIQNVQRAGCLKWVGEALRKEGARLIIDE